MHPSCLYMLVPYFFLSWRWPQPNGQMQNCSYLHSSTIHRLKILYHILIGIIFFFLLSVYFFGTELQTENQNKYSSFIIIYVNHTFAEQMFFFHLEIWNKYIFRIIRYKWYELNQFKFYLQKLCQHKRRNVLANQYFSLH